MDEVTRTAERIELEAAEDCYAAPGASVQKQLGIRTHRAGSSLVIQLATVADPVFNRALGAGVSAAATRAEIGEIAELFRAANVNRFFVHLCPGATPAEIRQWLTDAGLVRYHRSWAKFVWGGGGLPTPRPGLRVEAARVEHASIFAQIVTDAFGIPEQVRPVLEAVVGRERWHVYVCFDGETPISAGAMFVHQGAAWLGFGATLAPHRGRGGQQAILAQRVRDAHALGCRTVVTETGEQVPSKPQHSYHNIVRTGFRVHYLRENYTQPES
jgi:hypothetical protein